jgi:excisionase family DNA binding protein
LQITGGLEIGEILTAIFPDKSRPTADTAACATSIVERQTYSVPEAANILGVHKETLYNAIKRGEIKAIQIGRRTVISQAQLDAVLAP